MAIEYMRTLTFDAPADLQDKLDAWTDESELPEPVPPREAATVVLVRDSLQGVEVFMIRRASSMAFAPDRMAFPGGRIDPSDRDEVPWSGWTPARCGKKMGFDDVEAARRAVIAAVRETYEECGVLLAETADGDLVSDLSSASWAGSRSALESREMDFATFLQRSELAIRADLLQPLSRWVTPEREHRRYDTMFFAAVLPSGQQAAADTGEASWGGWILAKEAARQGREGGAGVMLPPTLVTVEDIARMPCVGAVMSRVCDLRPIMPRLERSGDTWVISVELPGRPAPVETHMGVSHV